MDKDLIILKSEEISAEEAQEDIATLEKKNDDQQSRLAEIQKRIDALYNKTGRTKLVAVPSSGDSEQAEGVFETIAPSYEQLYEESRQLLVNRGLDIENIGFDSFLSGTELAGIVAEMDQAVPREDRWKRSDFIVVFIAALVGGIADVVLGDRNNKLTGKGSKFSDWLNDIHERKWKHKSGSPIDFQGEIDGLSFGGGYHRVSSRGHDLFRFVDAIDMIKTGRFKVNSLGKVIDRNQFGKPYESMTLIAAVIEYCHHMLADLFSNYSLPFPGYSFLRECDNRKLRQLSADMYRNGFNLKNVIVQAASTVAIEIIIRLYFGIQSVKKYNDSIEIEEDYSNWEAIRQFTLPANKDKLHEMLLLAHTIVTAINIGKIVITKNIATINVTEITSVVKYGVKVLKDVGKRNRDYAKLIYHSADVQDRWGVIANEVGIGDDVLIDAMTENLVIA